MKGLACAAVLMVALSACAPNVRPDTYSVGSVGQVNRTVAGTILSARQVNIDGSQGGGAAAGAAVGGVAGSSIGSGGRSSAAGAIGGVVAGAIIGAATERSVSATTGIEYVVETANGNLMTLVQGPEPAFAAGEHVLVLYGSPARVIKDPRQH